MASGLISIAVTGINAAQVGLMTTGNNITNASSDGYSRQRVIQASNPTVMTGAGGIGQGTHVVTVARMYDKALTTQVLNAQSRMSALDTYSSQISQIDNMLADAEAGLSPAIQDFFDGIQAVSAAPSSVSARQSMVSAAQTMTSVFQSVYSRLAEMQTSVDAQIRGTVNSINSYTQQIAEINKQILSTASLNNQPDNQLLDKRDQLVAELNKLVKVGVSTNDDGSYNVFVGTGQQLVVRADYTKLSAGPSGADPTRIAVGLEGATGNVLELPESLISGGQLGGLLSFRREALDTAFNQLGMMATSIAQTFNAQHALGQDMLGNTSSSAAFISDFFSVTQPTVLPDTRNSLGSTAVSATLLPPSNNGTNFYTNLTGSDYRLSYDGATFTLERLSDNTTWSGATIGAINTAAAASLGFDLSPATGGTFAAGDSYLIQPTRTAARKFSVNDTVASDPRLIAAATPARASVTLTNTGSSKVQGVSVANGYTLGAANLTLTYNSGTNSFDLPDGSSIPYSSGQAMSINNATSGWTGISMTVSGVPANGDTVILQRNIGSTGVEDGSNALRLGNLQIQNTMRSGTTTYLDSYASFVNDIGNKTHSATVSSDAQSALLSQAVAAKEAVSGVNLDEEAAKLIQYQQAYQASAKILEVASTLFDTLISIR